MELVDLVHAVLRIDMLVARQWIADAKREGFSWTKSRRPEGLDARQLAVAAALVGLMSERQGTSTPRWVSRVPPANEDVWLIPSALEMPRLRRDIEANCPAALKRKRVYATANFLTIA
jgi:hypothetical protein